MPDTRPEMVFEDGSMGLHALQLEAIDSLDTIDGDDADLFAMMIEAMFGTVCLQQSLAVR